MLRNSFEKPATNASSEFGFEVLYHDDLQLTGTAATQDDLIDDKQLQLASSILRALAHPLRLRILSLIDKQKGEVEVNKIYEAIDLEQPITSQHIRILRLAGILSTRKDNETIYYRIEFEKLSKVSAAVDEFLYKAD